MPSVLRNKNLTTRLQIMVEVADKGPFIHQRAIASELNITPQAVSEYLSHLIHDGMIISEGKSRYRLTKEGVDWVIHCARELKSYTGFIDKAITNLSVSAAIAEGEVIQGQKVGLLMRRGLLMAVTPAPGTASGIATSSAKAGEDVGITQIEGIIPLEAGRVTVLRIPAIENGGSRQTNLSVIKRETAKGDMVFARGIEAITTLNKLGITCQPYGTTDGAIEAARSGLSPAVVCTAKETIALLDNLDSAGIGYNLIDASA